MVKHFIIVNGSSSKGKMVALDIIDKGQNDTDRIKEIVLKTKEVLKGHASFFTFSIYTNSEEWASVVKAAPYFEMVRPIDSLSKLVEEVFKSRFLMATDIAEYILTKIPCTLSKLENLCYLCILDYFCKTGKIIVNDEMGKFITKFRGGIRLDFVYKKYKKYGDAKLCEHEKLIEMQKQFTLPREFKILFSENGIEKVRSINNMLDKYSHLPADEIAAVINDKGLFNLI